MGVPEEFLEGIARIFKQKAIAPLNGAVVNHTPLPPKLLVWS
jgi:hypothetical protein